MEILLVDGILDGQTVNIKNPKYNIVLAFSYNSDKTLDIHTYYPWIENTYIAEGKLNNVRRIRLECELEVDENNYIIPLNENDMFDQANKMVKKKYGKSARLVNYRIHKKNVNSNLEDERIIIGIFDYYIYF